MFTAYHSETDRAIEWMNQNVELYLCMFSSIIVKTTEQACFMIWASHKQSWLCLNRGELLLLVLWVLHEASTTTWEVEVCTICKKFSTESWSDCTEDERSHRVNTDDYDCHSAGTERSNKSKDSSLITSKEDKVWLNLKNIHTDCLCRSLMQRMSSTSLLRRLAHIHSVWTHCQIFIMCFIQSCFSQQSWMLFSQCMTDSQFLPQIVMNEESLR
jgi:hypothetical protein